MSDHSSKAKEEYDVESSKKVVFWGRHIRAWRYFFADLSYFSIAKGKNDQRINKYRDETQPEGMADTRDKKEFADQMISPQEKNPQAHC